MQEPAGHAHVMHGGGDNAAYWLTDGGMGRGTRPVLDNLFKKGECADTIVVTPTFYAMPEDGSSYGFAAMTMTQYFWKELKNDIHFWYNGNGSADMAHDEHCQLWQTALAEMPDRFVDGHHLLDGIQGRRPCLQLLATPPVQLHEDFLHALITHSFQNVSPAHITAQD